MGCEHIAEVTAKANWALNLLKWTMYGFTKNAKKRAYIAHVRPHLEYYVESLPTKGF